MCPFLISSHYEEPSLPNFSRTCVNPPALWTPTPPPTSRTAVRTHRKNTGSLAQAVMLLAPPEGMAKLQEPFQNFSSRFLLGLLTSSHLQQGIPIALWHFSLCNGICRYVHSFTVYDFPFTTVMKQKMSPSPSSMPFKVGYGMFPYMKLGRKLEWLPSSPIS